MGEAKEQEIVLKEGEVPVEEGPEAQAPSFEGELDQLREELKKREEELHRLNDRFLRLAAEFDNYKKRMAREREEFLRSANEELIVELLPVLDNLERALAAARAQAVFQALLDGVEMTLRLFLTALGKVGVRPMEALGKEFDPRFHQAVLLVESPDGLDNMVVEEVERGYFLEDRVLRPALVKVSKVPQTFRKEPAVSDQPSGISPELNADR